MAVSLLVLAPLVLCAGLTFELALPGYHFQFPRDHFSHPGFQTEWWYYTGNLRARDGRRFGFELTFFRKAMFPHAPAPAKPASPASPPSASAWTIDDLYLAHLALSDIDGHTFESTERLNRAGPGLAGAALEEARIWNGNWQVNWKDGRQLLEAVAENFSVSLDLKPLKPPVVNGRDGISRKGKGPGAASHYISFTRLATTGALTLRGQRLAVTGVSWMDHEFFTHQLGEGQVGWDWLSIQLDNNTELMLFRLRHADGSADPYSAGTFVDRAGQAHHLDAAEFILEPLAAVGGIWTSPATGARYPVRWHVRVPGLGVELECSTALPSQELVSHSNGPNYWEGAVGYEGRAAGARIRGAGYLEMTGYDKPMTLE